MRVSSHKENRLRIQTKRRREIQKEKSNISLLVIYKQVHFFVWLRLPSAKKKDVPAATKSQFGCEANQQIRCADWNVKVKFCCPVATMTLPIPLKDKHTSDNMSLYNWNNQPSNPASNAKIIKSVWIFFFFFFFFLPTTNKQNHAYLAILYLYSRLGCLLSLLRLDHKSSLYLSYFVFCVCFCFFFAEMLYKLHLFIDEQIWACAVDAGKPTLDDIRAYCWSCFFF